jgi:hypothetical protein
MTLKIEVISWHRRKNVTGLIRLMGRQPCPVENVGSPIYKKQNTNKKSLKIYTDSLPLKKGYIPSPNRNKKSHNINMGSQ